MKAKILEQLDEKIAGAEKSMTPNDPKVYSNIYGYWKGLLDAREIVQKTEEEDVKHG